MLGASLDASFLTRASFGLVFLSFLLLLSSTLSEYTPQRVLFFLFLFGLVWSMPLTLYGILYLGSATLNTTILMIT